MRVTEKTVWIPGLAFFLGIGLPLIFVDFAENSQQARIYAGIIIFTLILSSAIFRKVGNKYPKLRNWLVNTMTGATIIFFFAGFLASSLTAIYAMLPLPLPGWLHFLLGLVLVFWVLVILSKTRTN